MLDTRDYESLKKELKKQFLPDGDELEWQYRLQSRRQKAGESLIDFAGDLRLLVDKKWEVKQQLEVARNQELNLSTVQLTLM